MCSTSFLQVTDESGMTLADLIPVGYKDVTEWTEKGRNGFKGKLSVKVLNNGGGLETDTDNKDKWYKFQAPWSKSGGWGETSWTQQQLGGAQTPVADPTQVKFPIGTGLWIEVSADSYYPTAGINKYPNDQYKIQHSGAAMLAPRQIELRPGSKGVAITVSSDITLANIRGVGYLDVTEWTEKGRNGFKGKLSVKVLNNGGGLETDTSGKDKWYKYQAPWSKSGGWGETSWTQQQLGGAQTPVADPTQVKFPIGTGLWIEVTADSYFPTAGVNKYPDNQYKVEFDGIEDL